MTTLLFIVLLGVIFFWIKGKNKLKKNINDLELKLKVAEKEEASLNLKIQILVSKNEALIKYEGLIDVELKASEIIIEAETISRNLKESAQEELAQAKLEVNEIKLNANTIAQNMRNNAELFLTNATEESNRIIEDANKNALQIAGDAYKALQNAAELEKTAKAMKNIILGYGSEYLVPTLSLLDDLAEEFGHTEGGERLKATRERSRILIKTNSAAKCDYAEANRKETAINFVLDAFNGKVDSVLSKVKKDNYGILEQKIKDAFQIVNNNGKAFRNAAITPEYLSARIDELKWAVIVQELKWLEQEEQRQIKEQIREEEKARREFEKAIREAEKEEETLKKLIEKARKEVDFSNDEQKAKYEEKLLELESKLKQAEEKNQRAISMAQQTRSGNVYIISNIGSFGENVYKIGMTRRLEPLDRVRELGDASVPFEFDVHSMIYSEDAPNLERQLHKKFLLLQVNKVNPRKEFFKVSLSDIKQQVEQMGIVAKWTLTAEARQFKETLAIEEQIMNDNTKRKEWEQSQMNIDPVSIEIDEEQEV